MTEMNTNITIKPAHGNVYEVAHTCPTMGTTITLAVLPTEDAALLWLNVWWWNVQLGHSQLSSFRLANQFVNDETGGV